MAAGGEAYGRAFDTARARIAELLDRPGDLPRRPRTTRPSPRPATCPACSPAITSARTAPRCPGTPAAGKEPGPVRQIVRRAARGAYRHGVQRVAPVIRRMGELWRLPSCSRS
ncbi:hypothetical protein SHIRM173S_00006 [Streptomyces hirsutus]